jgi:hypothetical protein
MRLGCIVEGHGEVQALPVLVRRIAQSANRPGVQVDPVVRVRRGQFLKPGELERTVELVIRQLDGPKALLILLDADSDCPAELGVAIAVRARASRPDATVSVVLARQEFESWFLAAAESLAGSRGLPHGLTSPPNPEDVRGAKEWLSRHMEAGRGYRETVDQAALVAKLDLTLAQRAPSFRRCHREIAQLLECLGSEGAG